MGEFLSDLRENWDNGYWWADRQLLMMVLLGVISLAFYGIRLWMERRWGSDRGES